MRRALIITAALFAAIGFGGSAARAQDGGPDTGAPGAYAAQDKTAFYDVEGRIAAMEAKAATLGRTSANRAKAALRSIKAFVTQQKTRHGGELRDWDREAVTARLNLLQTRHPELAG